MDEKGDFKDNSVGLLDRLVLDKIPLLNKWIRKDESNFRRESSMQRRNEVITKIRNNESIFVVDDGGDLDIINSRLASSGNTTKEEDSLCNGLNAGILAKKGSTINIKDSTITTAGKGASAVFSSGENSVINIDNIIIKTKGHFSNGLNAAYRGTVMAHDIAVNTEGKNSSPIATYMENGIINVENSSGTAEGEESPCIYSRGSIVVTDSNFKAERAEAAVVDGSSVVINNTSLRGNNKNGVVLFQKKEKNKDIGKCIFTSSLGSITAGKGAMFYVTNTEAIVNLFNTKLNLSMDNILINAKKDKWGKEGKNGGIITLLGNRQTLKGDILCDELSLVELKLREYTYYTGVIDFKNTGNVSVTLDSTSVWTLTGTSYIDYIINENKELKNIVDNGYNIFYNVKNEKNSWLEGKEIVLSGGGRLIPA
ncbi:MAG: hypothetical protein K5986_08200 [Clostridium sp.]|uniref:hypothetical protein n=1 Tax=Clostridium sp. DSM 8431 TaxID=1761781 RepID=UPI0008E2FB73|nr:hypothetical protein [Clostridium sp. DSM 8431]MCR4944414.1 hypothetical protein [Clostridium sp.]SFU88749.1 hypothetical protein SAMN04487886_12721 [Clostridium sp. DSM 8431]